jgi:hypothetical protein
LAAPATLEAADLTAAAAVPVALVPVALVPAEAVVRDFAAAGFVAAVDRVVVDFAAGRVADDFADDLAAGFTTGFAADLAVPGLAAARVEAGFAARAGVPDEGVLLPVLLAPAVLVVAFVAAAMGMFPPCE